jgi:hypothetical protein
MAGDFSSGRYLENRAAMHAENGIYFDEPNHKVPDFSQHDHTVLLAEE